MNSKRLWLFVCACVALAGIWYWFRPERLFTNQRVNEGLPSAALAQNDQPLYTGRFQGEIHKTSGQAAVFPASNGSRSLRLTDFKTSNGPDVHVILVSSANVSADKDFALDPEASIDLGDLKGNEGDQSYVIPMGADLSHYDVVSIYCVRFHANFGIARFSGRP
jgi:Electron transfer DM13